jgi:hypothetical protein
VSQESPSHGATLTELWFAPIVDMELLLHTGGMLWYGSVSTKTSNYIMGKTDAHLSVPDQDTMMIICRSWYVTRKERTWLWHFLRNPMRAG